MPVEAQATQGTDQNILLIESGDAQLGFRHHRHRPSSVERQRRLDPRQEAALDARAVPDVRHPAASFSQRKAPGLALCETWPTSGSARAPRAALQERMPRKRSLRRSGSPRPYALAPGTPSAHSCTPAFSMLLSARPGSRFLSLPNSTGPGKSACVPLSVVEIAKLRKAMPELSASVVSARDLSLAEDRI